MSGGGRTTDVVVHSSAHPNLPPAQPQQVVQFLLARNYWLTALELLVESQQSGRGQEVPELKAFFSDGDRFPPEELVKYQGADALDAQVASREREERLQLAEYELRLAKEDLAEMHKRVAVQAERIQEADTRNGAAENMSIGSPIPASPKSPTSIKQDPAGTLPSHSSITATAALPSPSQTVSAHQAIGGEGLHDPTAADIKVLNAAVLSYLVQQGYRMAAMTLQEEVAEDTAEPSTPGGEKGKGQLLWRWYSGAHVQVLQPPPDTGEISRLRQELQRTQEQLQQLQQQAMPAPPVSAASVGPTEFQNGASPNATSLGADSIPSTAAGTQSGFGTTRRSVSEEEDAGALQIPRPSEASAGLEASALNLLDSSSSLSGAGNTAERSLAGLNRPESSLNVEQLSTLQHILATVADLLPRIASSMTMKCRLDVLPLTAEMIPAVGDDDVRQALVAMVFNLISNPDAGQCQAIVGVLSGLGAKFGAAWTAAEVVPLCCKQVTNSSSERRTLVAEVLGACIPLLDLGTQAHVVLTQLHRLAEDRVETVRAASVRALSALLLRLPFSGSYYSTMEEMLLQLAKDGSDAVFEAVEQQLVPALLHFAADQDVVAMSLLPKVIADITHLVRKAAPPPSPPLPTTSSSSSLNSLSGGPNFTGSLLNYSLAPATTSATAASSSPAAPPPPATSTGVSSGSIQNLPLASSQLPPLHPPHSQRQHSRTNSHVFPNPHLDRSKWACLEHQVAWQLLALFLQLQGPLQATALRHCPAWATEAALKVSAAAEAAAAQDAAAGTLTPTHLSPPAINGGGDSIPQQASGVPPALQLERAASLQHSGSAPSASGPSGSGPSAALLFGTWAASKQPAQWKTVQWVVQYVVPELLESLKLIPIGPDTLELRKQLAHAFAAICSTFGHMFSRSVLVPCLVCAAGALQYASAQPLQLSAVLEQAVSEHVSESALELMPRSHEAAAVARERVLPILMAAVLPGANMLSAYLLRVLGGAEKLSHRWMQDALLELTAALTFACQLRGQSADVQAVLQQLAVSTSAATGLCGVAVARALIPVANAETISRRVLPSLMALLSGGNQSVQRACIGAMMELLLHQKDDLRVVEQVFVVYDGLLEQGSHDTQVAVIGAGARLASAIAGSAATSAAAAQQLEWLLHAVHGLAVQLQPSAAAAAAGASGGTAAALLGLQPPGPPSPLTPSPHPRALPVGPGGVLGLGQGQGQVHHTLRTLDQARELAVQLAMVLQAVHSYDVRLPRLVSSLASAVEALRSCKSLLPDGVHPALTALLKERPTGSGSGGGGISSSSVATGGASLLGALNFSSQAQQPAAAGSFGSAIGAAAAAGSGAAPAAAGVGGGGTVTFNSMLRGIGSSNAHSAAGPAAATAGSNANTSGEPPAGGLKSRFADFRKKVMRPKQEEQLRVGGGMTTVGSSGGVSKSDTFGNGLGGGVTAVTVTPPVSAHFNFFSDDEGDD